MGVPLTSVRLNGEGATPVAATPAVAPQTVARPAVAPAETSGATTFRVQFLSTPRNLKSGDPDLGGITDIKVEKIGKVYAYLAGNYTTRREAEQRCADIKAHTPFKDAFVVAYRNGERIK